MLAYKIALALHIIGFTSWFAGLLYLVRLFIYHTEAQSKNDPARSALSDQFKIMEKRLWYGISWPAMIFTFLAGLYLMHLTKSYLQIWFQLKAVALTLLFFYHIKCGSILKELKHDRFKWSSFKLRLWNELGTLLLVVIVFIAILKDLKSITYATLGFFVFAIILMLSIKALRKKNN